MAVSIVGTWKLVRATAKDGDGAAMPEPYGGKGIGRVTFTAEGRMQAGRVRWAQGIAGGRRPRLQLRRRQLHFRRQQSS